jgi:putative salt-induced outer membrane protein YdiY
LGSSGKWRSWFGYKLALLPDKPAGGAGLAALIVAGLTAAAAAGEIGTNPPAAQSQVDVIGPVTNASPDTATNLVPAVTNVPPPAVQAEPARPGEKLGSVFQSSTETEFGMSKDKRRLKMTERPVRPKPEESWDWNLEAGLNTAKGNSDLLRYTAALSARKEDELNFFWLKVAGNYGESEGTKDTDNAQANGKYERLLTGRLYTSLDGEWFRDRIADLSYRTRVSLSLGYHFILTDKTVFSLEAGPGYIREKKGGIIDDYVAGRAADYFERKLNDSVILWQFAEYVPSLEDGRIYYVNAEVGLETLLVADLSLKFVLQDRYDSAPAAGKKHNDLLTTTSLNWSF